MQAGTKVLGGGDFDLLTGCAAVDRASGRWAHPE
jgi:hypothetical protein